MLSNFQKKDSPGRSGFGYRGAVSGQTIGLVGGSLLFLAVIGYFILAGSSEGLLDKDELTPDEIRTVATELLRHEDLEIRERANRKLADQGAKAVPVLKEICLSDRDEKLKEAILPVLANLDEQASLEVARQLADDPSEEMRWLAMEAAGRVSGDEATEILGRGLNDSSKSVRLKAIRYLTGRDVGPVRGALEAAARDDDKTISRHAQRALDAAR